MRSEGQISVDAPSVAEAQATFLMIHHLSLAAMYFEATPDGLDAIFTEIETQELNDYAKGAAQAFAVALDNAYKED